MRKTTSAPTVNHRRFFSSVALPIAPQFRLDASCSAADAMKPHAGTTRNGGRHSPNDAVGLGRFGLLDALGPGLALDRQLDRAAGLLDRGNRRRRGARDLHVDLG